LDGPLKSRATWRGVELRFKAVLRRINQTIITMDPDESENLSGSLARLERQAETKGFLPRRALGSLQGAGNFCGPRPFARKLLQCANIFGGPRASSSFH
jgi:hypothetical protein